MSHAVCAIVMTAQEIAHWGATCVLDEVCIICSIIYLIVQVSFRLEDINHGITGVQSCNVAVVRSVVRLGADAVR